MDKKAKRILLKTYWKNGWIDDSQRVTIAEDFQYAKAKGVMLDPLTISHDRCLNDILALLSVLSQERVAKAFLSSLSSRRLELKSGLASFYIAQQLVPHKYTPVVSGNSYGIDGNIVYTSYSC